MSILDWDWDTIGKVAGHLGAVVAGVGIGTISVLSFGAIPAMGVALGAAGTGLAELIAVPSSQPKPVMAKTK
jgi:hypothetical protein